MGIRIEPRQLSLNLIALLIAILAVTTLLRLRPAPAYADAPYATLDPASSFAIPVGDEPLKVQDTAASGNEIYALCLSGKGAPPQAVLVAMDRVGTLTKRLNFQTTADRDTHMSLVQSGKVALFKRRSPASGFVLDVHSGQTQMLNVGGPIEYLAPVSGTLMRVTDIGSTLLNDSASDKIPLPITEPFLAFSSSSDHVAIITLLTAHLIIISTDSVVTPAMQLAAAEISGIPRRADLAEGAIRAAGSDSMGHIFCAISPYKRDQGVPVLEFDEAGNLLSRFRCRLPMTQRAQTSSNPLGYAAPTALTVTGRTLVVTAHDTNIISLYNLP